MALTFLNMGIWAIVFWLCPLSTIWSCKAVQWFPLLPSHSLKEDNFQFPIILFIQMCTIAAHQKYSFICVAFFLHRRYPHLTTNLCSCECDVSTCYDITAPISGVLLYSYTSLWHHIPTKPATSEGGLLNLLPGAYQLLDCSALFTSTSLGEWMWFSTL